jgi:hypothetical protein
MVINFEFETQYGKYSDTLFLDEDHEFSDAEIQSMKQSRLDKWVAHVTAPQPDYVLDSEGNIVFDENGNALTQG